MRSIIKLNAPGRRGAGSVESPVAGAGAATEVAARFLPGNRNERPIRSRNNKLPPALKNRANFDCGFMVQMPAFLPPLKYGA